MITRREVTLLGHRGRFLHFTSEQFEVAVRLFAVGQRLYQIGYVAMRGEFTMKAVGDFMNSFRLTR